MANNATESGALGFEADLWVAADKMRGHMDASEYKHVCLGLIFLKYISDAFEEKREQLLFGFSDPQSEWFIKDEPERKEAAENRDEYLAANVFWLPPEARWHTIKAKSAEIGKVIDDAMGAIERENPTLKGVLPPDYARPSLDKVRLGGLVEIISNIGFNESAAKSKDVLGRFEFAEASMARLVGAFMRSPNYFEFVAGCIGGSAQPNASAQVLAGAQLAVPPLELAQRFANTVAPGELRVPTATGA